MTDLPTLEPIKPIGKCGECGRDLYPHSTPNICGYKEACPMHGQVWMNYQAMRRMQNTFVGEHKPFDAKPPQDR